MFQAYSPIVFLMKRTFTKIRHVKESRYICMFYVLLSGIFTIAACGHTATHSLNLIPRHATVGRNVSLQIIHYLIA